MRYEPVQLLEIGIGGYEGEDTGGASLRMWQDYFENGTIHGLDYEKKSVSGPRIKVHRGSQADPVVIAQILSSLNGQGLDIIIDDGSHRSEHIIATFIMTFQYLKHGGWYVVEDTQTSYWHAFGGRNPGDENGRTTMSFFKSLIDDINWMEQHRPGLQPDYCATTIESIHFYHNLIFIKKGDNVEASNYVKNNVVPGH